MLNVIYIIKLLTYSAVENHVNNIMVVAENGAVSLLLSRPLNV